MSELLLEKQNGILTLTDGKISSYCDFSNLIPRLKINNLNAENIVKAAKIKESLNPICVDMTAGLGEDSFLIAASGFNVYMFESNKTIFTLLKDGLDRAKENELLKDIAERITAINENSIEGISKISSSIDVVYLDPMFPERQKSSLIKKKFQLLQQLERPCNNGEELLEAAISVKPKKIVIKRPLKAEFLGGRKASYQINGKTIRYDVIVL